MTRRLAIVVVAMVALACGLSACGVDAESQPKVIERSDVPFGLAQRDRSTPATVPERGSSAYILYFVSGKALQPVTRSARMPRTPTATLRELVRGPNRTDTEAGLSTLLAPDLKIDRVAVDDGTATVQLGGEGAAGTATDQQSLGIAQLVYTATGLPGVERVRFEIDGRPAEVPRGDGTLSSHAVDRADYPTVAPLAIGPSTNGNVFGA